ncbi:MAG: flippase [Candidatus Aminicenantes bacterium]|nr:flippase [Candidatus Aminicenantes bacterium]
MNPNESPLEISGGVIARNTFMNLAGLALPVIVGVATIPLTIRLMGTERFGILSLAWVVFGYFSYLDLGLGMATTRFVAEALGKRDMEQIPRYFWTTVTFQAFMGFLGAAALSLSAPYLIDHVLNIPAGFIRESKTTFYLLAVSLPPVLVSASFRGALEARQRFDLVNLVKIPSSVLNYGLPSLGAALGLKLPGIIVLLIITRLLTLVVLIVLCFKVFPVLRRRFVFQSQALKPVLRYGIWVMVSNALGPILVYLDRFLIGALLTVTAVSFYTAPYEAVMRLGIVPYSLLMTLFPMFSALQGGGDEKLKRFFFRQSVKFLLVSMGFVAVILVFFADRFLGLYLGAEYALKGTLVFQIIAVGFFLYSLTIVPYGFLQGIGRSDLVAKFYLAELVVYVPLAWLTIRAWGIAGAALAWTTRVAMDMVLMFIAARKLGKFKFSALFGGGTGQAALWLAGLSVVGIGLKRVAWGTPVFALVLLVFVVVLWFRVFDAEEKSWIRTGLHKMKAKVSR